MLQYHELSSLVWDTPIIWIDVDWVLSDTIKTALQKVEQKYGKTIHISEWIAWSPHEIESLRSLGMTEFSHTAEFFFDVIREENGYQLDPIVGAQLWVARLRARWKILKALSGREEETRNWTESWIHRYYPWAFSEVFLANTGVALKDIPKYEFAQ